jgi:hypothetical protein
VKKTVWPSLKDTIDDMDKIARDLQDIKSILCCIAWQQTDKKLQVPFSALAEMPLGIEMEIGIDRLHGNYVFTAIPPSDPASVKNVPDDPALGESSGLAADNKVAGGLG